MLAVASRPLVDRHVFIAHLPQALAAVATPDDLATLRSLEVATPRAGR